MTQLLAYIRQHRIKQRDLALRIGISAGYLSDLAKGIKTPSLELAFSIERVTCGAVPVASWDKSPPAHNQECTV